MSLQASTANSDKIIVAAMYQFKEFPEFETIRQPLLDFCLTQKLKGTLLLASEGINGTVAGSRKAITAIKQYLTKELFFDQLEYKESLADEIPFHRMKVKLKKEIVTLGKPEANPGIQSGERLGVKQWNDVINDPDVLVIDTRNQYEVDIGTFRNAISPETETFREFPEFVSNKLNPQMHRKVAMFCTGGIRCEKASSYLLNQGFENVYQLDGGILRYLENVAKTDEENLWQGDCFVFDGRVSVDKNLEEGDFEQCFACRHPVSEVDMKSEQYEQGVSCPNCYDEIDDKKRQRFAERQKQVELAESRGTQHIGAAIHSDPDEAHG